MADCAGATDLSKREAHLISKDEEMGIADVLSARQEAGWDWSGTDQGEHADIHAPV